MYLSVFVVSPCLSSLSFNNTLGDLSNIDRLACRNKGAHLRAMDPVARSYSVSVRVTELHLMCILYQMIVFVKLLLKFKAKPTLRPTDWHAALPTASPPLVINLLKLFWFMLVRSFFRWFIDHQKFLWWFLHSLTPALRFSVIKYITEEFKLKRNAFLFCTTTTVVEWNIQSCL